MSVNAVIAQGGGPTAVINESLVGAVLEAIKSDKIDKIYGALHGVQGIVEENFIDLTLASTSNLNDVAKTTSSALLSTRVKPDDAYCEKIFTSLKAHDIKYFYYIGGNDSADTCRILSEKAIGSNYDLKVVHIPKTIDNDLRVTDHCPGFGSAAKFVAQAFAGLNNDNRSLPGVFLGVVMGRDAGFLTAASALAKRYDDDAPHLIYVPEAVFDKDKFLSDIQKVYDKLGRCVIAVSEGIKDSDGNPIISSLVSDVERDSHGNIQLSGTGALCDSLVDLIKNGCNVNKVRGDTFGYLQRSFSGVVSETDAKEARSVGEMAVKYSLEDGFIGGSIAIKRVGDYAVTFEPTPLNTVARHTKSLPENFYNAESAMVTDEFIKYASPIAGEIDRGVRIFAPVVNKVIGE